MLSLVGLERFLESTCHSTVSSNVFWQCLSNLVTLDYMWLPTLFFLSSLFWLALGPDFFLSWRLFLLHYLLYFCGIPLIKAFLQVHQTFLISLLSCCKFSPVLRQVSMVHSWICGLGDMMKEASIVPCLSAALPLRYHTMYNLYNIKLGFRSRRNNTRSKFSCIYVSTSFSSSPTSLFSRWLQQRCRGVIFRQRILNLVLSFKMIFKHCNLTRFMRKSSQKDHREIDKFLIIFKPMVQKTFGSRVLIYWPSWGVNPE